MVTINNNLGQNIPILEYANTIFNDGEWGGDAEISMIPLIYHDIRVATYKLIVNLANNSIIGYQFINCYGNMNDIKTSILILVNINNNHWTTAYFNDKNGQPINNYIINPISLINNKKELIKKNNKINNIYLDDDNLIKIKAKYNEFLKELNNLNNKTINEVYNFYNSEQNKIDFSSIYYYIKNKDINNGLFGSYTKNFHLITKHKGSREDKKLFKKNVKLSQ